MYETLACIGLRGVADDPACDGPSLFFLFRNPQRPNFLLFLSFHFIPVSVISSSLSLRASAGLVILSCYAITKRHTPT